MTENVAIGMTVGIVGLSVAIAVNPLGVLRTVGKLALGLFVLMSLALVLQGYINVLRWAGIVSP